MKNKTGYHPMSLDEVADTTRIEEENLLRDEIERLTRELAEANEREHKSYMLAMEHAAKRDNLLAALAALLASETDNG